MELAENEETYPGSLPQHQRPAGAMECPVLVLLTRFTLRLWMGTLFLKAGHLNKTVSICKEAERNGCKKLNPLWLWITSSGS
ncbi:hypothetical protein VULLAG_LOCUS19719 [Vulpes lagopus]